MIIAIHQPDYMPYPGYFYKIAHSDCFIFLDDAQFSNENNHNWNRIKTPQGQIRLKAPVKQTLGDVINEVGTRDELNWKQKHLKTLKLNYARAKFFDQIFPEIEALLMADYANLAEMNMAIIRHICSGFGISPEFKCSSPLRLTTCREERIIDICLAYGGSIYLSGNGARSYQVPEHFSARGVILTYSDYRPVTYRQLWGNFLPNMSILDYLFNQGYDWELIEGQIVEYVKNKR